MNYRKVQYYVYEFSYPEGMEHAGIVFYVGKGTGLYHMDNHFNEAGNGCDCAKCEAIRSIWNTGLAVVRSIVFETLDESEAINEERRRILLHDSPFLTNVSLTERVHKPQKPKSQVARKEASAQKKHPVFTSHQGRPYRDLYMGHLLSFRTGKRHLRSDETRCSRPCG